METALKYLLLYPAEALALLSLLVLVAGYRLPDWWALGVAALAALALCVRTAVWFPECFDLRLFWDAGNAVWRGGDPYREDVRILNPPTAFPFFAALALLPYEELTVAWSVLNVLLAMALAPLAAWALWAQRDSEGPGPQARTIAVVFAVTAFSYATRRGLEAGQVSLFFTIALMAALVAQGHRRPVLAGVFLALASAKAATWLPFLILFVRRRDWPVWPALAVAGFALALAATAPLELLDRCHECLDNIRVLAAPGRVNDYIPENTQTIDLLGLNYALYHLGVADRSLNQAVALGSLGLLTLLIAWFVLRANVPRAAACAAVCFYALLFLYHRQYDAVLLVVPLLYVTGRAAEDRSWRRWLYALAALSILAVLYIQTPLLEKLRAQALEGSLPPVVAAATLPYCTWALLAGLLMVIAAESLGGHTVPRIRPTKLSCG